MNNLSVVFCMILLITGCSTKQELEKSDQQVQELEKEIVSLQKQIAEATRRNSEQIDGFKKDFESIHLQNQIFFSSVIRGLYVPNIAVVEGKNVMQLNEFIAYLQSLKIFTENFIAERKDFFRQCMLDMEKLNVGADIGEVRDLAACEFYHYNLYMKTQEPASLFATRNLEVNESKATSELEFFYLDKANKLTLDTYLEVSYHKLGDTWLIDEARSKKKR